MLATRGSSFIARSRFGPVRGDSQAFVLLRLISASLAFVPRLGFAAALPLPLLRFAEVVEVEGRAESSCPLSESDAIDS